MRRLAIIGGGAWGTALGVVARRAGSGLVLWARDLEVVAAINERHENPFFLPAVRGIRQAFFLPAPRGIR